MSGVLMEYREAFRMYPIYKDFQEKARSDESQNKKLAEDSNEFDKLLKEIIHN
ncbi:MAG: hypothetical protein J5537_08355 [Lachnospiraceae bacterium]|nr:hypothetical protein [Lachnospiraceae bacterium]MBR5896866.1 hypothetical protein [Lachnospiraceae bacterium]